MKRECNEILCFNLDQQRLAVPLNAVDRVLRAMAVTIIPDAPPMVYGVIDYYGEVIAIINLREKLSLPKQEIQINDRFVIVNALNRKFGIVVDKVEGVHKPNELDVNDAQAINPDLQCSVILRDDDGIILVYNVESLLINLTEFTIQQPSVALV